MFELKQEVIEDIIKCEDPNLVESYINDEIITMKKKGFINLLIMRFIQKLDVTLVMLKRQDPSLAQSSNIQVARKTLMNKLIYGIDA